MLNETIDDFCRRKVAAYWLSYFLPERQSRKWVLFCYCFRKMDDFLDRDRKAETVNFAVSSAMSNRKVEPNSAFEDALYRLVLECKKDRRLLSAMIDAYEGEKRDSRRRKLLTKRGLTSITKGKSVAFTKIWVRLIEPSLGERLVGDISFKLGTCGQIMDDLKDMREDFAAGRVNVPRERLTKGRLVLKDVMENEYWRDAGEKAASLHSEALEKIKLVQPFRSRLLLLALALYLDSKNYLDGRLHLKPKGKRSNVLKSLSALLASAYPRDYRLGGAIASILGVPLLISLLMAKGYSKFLFGLA